MSKALREVLLGERVAWALFDSGAGRSYIVRNAIPSRAAAGRDSTPGLVGLGGREHRIQEWRTVIVEADGCDFSFKAYVLEENRHRGGPTDRTDHRGSGA